MKQAFIALVFILSFFSTSQALTITNGAAYYTYKWHAPGPDYIDTSKQDHEYVFFIDTNRPGVKVGANGDLTHMNDYELSGPFDTSYIFDYFFVEFISGPYMGVDVFEGREMCHYGGIDPFSEDVTQFDVSTSYGAVSGFAFYRGEEFYFTEFIGSECIDAGWFYLADITPAPVPEPATFLLVLTGSMFFFRRRSKQCG